MLRRSSARSNSAHRRRGTLYVGVMMTATVVAVVGLCGLSVSILGVRSAQNARDAEAAAVLARAAVEEGVRLINANPSWRTSLQNNYDYSPWVNNLNGGIIRFRYVDLDGNFNNNSADGLRVYGTGQYGKATYVESVLLQPASSGVTCLEAALHCQGNINLASYCNIVTPQFLSTNGSVTATATQYEIAGDVQASGNVTGSVTGSKSSGVSTRQMPGNTVFEYYLANGTWIDITAVPLTPGTRTISNQVFAPTLNPYGTKGNVEGIYVLDCQGQNLQVENTRVLGTLIIINPGTTCCFQKALLFSPVSPHFPAVMVQGNAQFDTAWDSLSELTQTKNFNPTGAPYENAVDSDTLDLYPSTIKGLTYVSGRLTIKANLAAECAFDGSVICTTIEMESTGDARFGYRPTHLNYPPPGFAKSAKMQIVPGTWQRTVLP